MQQDVQATTSNDASILMAQSLISSRVGQSPPTQKLAANRLTVYERRFQ